MDNESSESISRRDLATSILGKMRKGGATTPEEPIKNIVSSTTFSRRELLSISAKIGFALAAPPLSAGTVGNENINPLIVLDPRHEDSAPSVRDASSQENLKSKSEYVNTVVETALMEVSSVIASKILDGVDLPHGNQSITDTQAKDLLSKFDLKLITLDTVLLPIIEETVFRLYPSALLGKGGGNHWDVGIPTSALFALIHNFNQKDKIRLQFQNSIPISEFIGGLFYWYLVRERGFPHSVFAHTLGNSGRLAIGSLLYQGFPGSKAATNTAQTLIKG